MTVSQTLEPKSLLLPGMKGDEPRWYGVTLWQPYATLIALGWKTVETRSWPWRRPGATLVIHAAGRWGAEQHAAWKELIDAGLAMGLEGHGPAAGWTALDTLGRCLAVCTVARSVVSRSDAEWPEAERRFGDLRPGRHGWILEDIRALREPVRWQGMQGAWPVPDELKATLLERLEPLP